MRLLPESSSYCLKVLTNPFRLMVKDLFMDLAKSSTTTKNDKFMVTTLINSIHHLVLFQLLKLNVASHITEQRLLITFGAFCWEYYKWLPQHLHFGSNYYGCTANKGNVYFVEKKKRCALYLKSKNMTLGFVLKRFEEWLELHLKHIP